MKEWAVGKWGAETEQYRLKAAKMRNLADQANNELARAAYAALEESWLRLAQKSEEVSDFTPRQDSRAENCSA